jgi:hypothetical protein
MPNIIGFDACRTALESLVAAAKADLGAKKDGDRAVYETAVTSWERKFFEFRNAARPGPGEEDAVRELQTRATRMAEEIRQAQMGEIIGRIDALSRQIEDVGKTFGEQAAGNVAAARRGRLTPLKDALDSVAGAINQLKTLKNDLKADDPDERKIATEAQALIEKFETLKESIEAL